MYIHLGDENRSVEIQEFHVANWFRDRRKMKKGIDQNEPMFKYGAEFEESKRPLDVIEIVDVEKESRLN